MSAIIFDFDGTIADSFDYVVNFLAQEAGLDKITEAQRKSLHGMSMFAMARHLKYPLWRMPGLYLKGKRVMGQSITDVKPFDGMPEVIRKLQAEGHELFIVTSNNLHNVHTFLHHHNLHKYFLEVYASVSLFGKAGALKKLFKDQNLLIEDAYYIGDEVRDVKAAEKINLKTVAVSWGFANIDELTSTKPTKIVYKPSSLVSVLEEI